MKDTGYISREYNLAVKGHYKLQWIIWFRCESTPNSKHKDIVIMAKKDVYHCYLS